MSTFFDTLKNEGEILIHQKYELPEIIGYETRNKYEILDHTGDPIGFIAEQQKGVLNFLIRQFLGHWRTFEVFFFDNDKNIVFRCRHPFRVFFQRFEVRNSEGDLIGSLQRKFSILKRRFDILTAREEVLLEMSSPFFRFWTFYFYKRNREVARIEKKFSGLLTEVFTDKDHFKIKITDRDLSLTERSLLLASSIFVDLMYFERKANDN